MSTAVAPNRGPVGWLGHRDRAPVKVATWLSALGLYITLAGCCASDLRFTNVGLRMGTAGQLDPRTHLDVHGYPFVYEVGVALLCIGTAGSLIRDRGHLRSRAALPIYGVLVFYLPIFANALLWSPNIRDQFIGGGQLRLQMEAMLFGISLLLVPPTPKVLRWALMVVVLGALLNAFANVAYISGILVPLWPPVMRGTSGLLRYSGLFDLPTQVGLISALGAVAVLSVTASGFLRSCTISLCFMSAVIADSRTGALALALGLAVAWLYLRKHRFARWAGVAFLLLAVVTLSALILRDPAIGDGRLEQESARISGVLAVIENFWHHPLGVAWGSFDDLASSYYDAVSPHNWPAVALLYGGIISFAVAARFHVSMIGRLLDGKARARGRGDKFGDTLALVITCVACSWFEQAFQTGITLFTFLLAWAG